jgi:hypothetical protein
VGPYHRGKARPQVVDGGDDFLVRRVTANIFGKQSRTSEKRWSSSFVIGRGDENSSL